MLCRWSVAKNRTIAEKDWASHDYRDFMQVFFIRF